MLAAVLLIIFLLVVIVGVPISFAMGFMTISAFTIGNGAMVIIPQKMFSGVYNFTYMCIPLFILASEIMSRCGLTMSIVKFCDTLVGHIRGGLAHVNILASMLFAGISGSATADASGLGRIEMEMMTKAGYTKEYSAAVTAASAIIGPIIPPSNIMIIYAVCASNVSVSAMFLGGIMPGIVLGLAEMLLCYYFARKYNHPCRARRSSAREVLHSFKRSLPALGLPIIILGGIVSGVFTATESSAVAVFYALIVAICKRQITWKSLVECCKNTAKTTANVMLIISIASAMSYAFIVTACGNDELVETPVVTDISVDENGNPLEGYETWATAPDYKSTLITSSSIRYLSVTAGSLVSEANLTWFSPSETAGQVFWTSADDTDFANASVFDASSSASEEVDGSWKYCSTDNPCICNL